MTPAGEMAPETGLLSVQNLGRQVAGRWLWRGVSFTLPAGERLGLVAPSGAGKTLLMRSLVLLDPVQAGQITFAGKSPVAWSLPMLRRQMVYLPQRATAFPGTVEANLKQVFQLGVNRPGPGSGKSAGSHRGYNRDQVLTWLHQLGRSADFLGLQAAQLSGGEGQILALLRALQLAPRLLLLDEPTASLDGDTTHQVEALLYDWLQVGDRACLLTSHDRQQIERFTTQQLNLKEFQ
jgi:putative ABC transport system ATP-binding protein